MFRKLLSVRLTALTACALSLATLAGCGTGRRNPIPSGSVSGGLFVNAGTVAGRAASATLVPLSGATITLAKAAAAGSCTGGTTATTATTNANGQWTASISNAGDYYVAAINATGYSFTVMLNTLSCGAKTSTASLGATATPAGLPTASTSAQWTTNANLVAASTTDTGSLLVLATVNDSGQTTAPNATGLSVSVASATHPTGRTGTAITGVLTGSKSVNVVLATGSGLETPTAQTATVVAGGTVTASFTLDRVVSAINMTNGTASSGSTHNLATTCNLAAVSAGSVTLSASSAVTCPASKTITYALSPSTGTVSPGGVYTAPTSITTASTVTVTATTTSGGSTVTGTASLSLSPCPTATPDAIPGGGCGVLKTVTTAVTDAAPQQHTTKTLALTAACSYDTNGDSVGDNTKDCTSSATFFNGTTQLTGATLSLATAGAASITARVSAAAGNVTSTALAVNVQSRSLSSISLVASDGTVSYTTGSASPATITITPTCAYNTGTTYAESLNCTTIGESLNKTATTGTLTTDTYTPPATTPDTDTTVTITYSKTGTAITASTTVILSAGPQSCTGISTFCVDLSEGSGAAATAVDFSVTGANLPTGGLAGATLVFTLPTGVTASAITAGTGWTIQTSDIATSGRFSVVLTAGTAVTSNATFITVKLPGASAGVHTVSPVTTGTPRSSFTDNNANLVTTVSMRTGKLTVP